MTSTEEFVTLATRTRDTEVAKIYATLAVAAATDRLAKAEEVRNEMIRESVYISRLGLEMQEQSLGMQQVMFARASMPEVILEQPQ